MVARKRLSNKSAGTLEWMSLFSSPALLPGEDQSLYRKLLKDVFDEINPTDAIEKILVGDVVYLLWEIWRLRRLQAALIKFNSLDGLRRFLDSLGCDHYTEEITDSLTETLIAQYPDQVKKYLETLAQNGADTAFKEIISLLSATKFDLKIIMEKARAKVAKELAQAYARSEPKVVAWVNKMLLAEGTTLDAISSQALANSANDFEFLGVIERIARLITNAESRRNEVLRDLDRHRAFLAEALRRRHVEQIDGEIRLIEAAENGHDQRSQN